MRIKAKKTLFSILDLEKDKILQQAVLECENIREKISGADLPSLLGSIHFACQISLKAKHQHELDRCIDEIIKNHSIRISRIPFLKRICFVFSKACVTAVRNLCQDPDQLIEITFALAAFSADLILRISQELNGTKTGKLGSGAMPSGGGE